MAQSYGKLAAFIIGVLGFGMLIGYFFTPGPWFDTINKPVFQPPNWIFAPVWTVLYIIIGIVGWRVHQLNPDYGLRKLWWIQLVLNYLWSPAFFGAEKPWLAFVIIVPLWITIFVFIGRARKHDPASGHWMLPLLAWVSFATLLNAAIWRLNS